MPGGLVMMRILPNFPASDASCNQDAVPAASCCHASLGPWLGCQALEDRRLGVDPRAKGGLDGNKLSLVQARAGRPAHSRLGNLWAVRLPTSDARPEGRAGYWPGLYGLAALMETFVGGALCLKHPRGAPQFIVCPSDLPTVPLHPTDSLPSNSSMFQTNHFYPAYVFYSTYSLPFSLPRSLPFPLPGLPRAPGAFNAQKEVQKSTNRIQ